MEVSALTHASRLGLLGRRSSLLRLQGDDRLIALMREGQPRAFEVLVERYQVRLLAFCRGMLRSPEDAEDVMQEVMVAAHKAILADNRAINAKPWLYRIARNRCLNQLRKPVPEGQDSMDIHPHELGASVADQVQNREEFRALLGDVKLLPETQRSALLLREIEGLGYEGIALAMDTTVPAVKSLLVRARIALADSSQGRHLTCDEVHLQLAEAAEGLCKASGATRAHLRRCERCRAYRKELRRDKRALAALAPIGPLAALHGTLFGKLGLGGAKITIGSSAASGSGAIAGAGAGSAAIGGAGAVAAGGLSGAVGSKAAVGLAGLALLSAGAADIRSAPAPEPVAAPVAHISQTMSGGAVVAKHQDRPMHKPAVLQASAPSVAIASVLEPMPTAEPVPDATEAVTAVSGPAVSGSGVAAAPAEPERSDPPPVESPPVEPLPAPLPAPAPLPSDSQPAPTGSAPSVDAEDASPAP